ncbi:unnamed protein product [Thelazia callipaeda]|uniref:Zasp-like motif domain-containing protein n=1 Tax=Thelazia callipaeda TaxID=103827 RepID=A0A158RB50_THECL|nr:unnamed protein product [Thelazia callipaeda]
MSNYGSAGYLNRSRDYLFSLILLLAQDDYNRYETARSRSRTLQRHRYEDERSRFSGYGDRPGSGVELMPTKWHGGEIITDPIRLPRSLKPRRLYYSPIGDGVVAADGVELKRNPEDSSPRISVTHTRTVDRGELGKDGYNLYARTAGIVESDYGSDIGASGRNSRLTGGFSPGFHLHSLQYSGTGLHISNNSEQPQKFEMSKDYLITNPRELIHQYATMTPVSVLEIPETSRTVKKMYSSTIEEKFIPYPPYKSSETAIHPQNFVRQLRDEGLTASQKEANRHRKPLVSNDPQTMQKIWGIRDETNRTISSNKEIDYLTERMVHSLQTGRTTPHF